jgi:hypothetical protein
MSSCKDALCTFASRNELADHEINCHSMKSQGPLTNHGLFDRKFKFPGGRDMLDSISTSEGSFFCPLCRKDLGSSKRTHISHLAKHMESIALATLPPDPEDMSGDESDFSDHSDESVQYVEEKYPREVAVQQQKTRRKGSLTTATLLRRDAQRDEKELEISPLETPHHLGFGLDAASGATSPFRSNMKAAAREEEGNLYDHNEIMESPTFWDNRADFSDSLASSPFIVEYHPFVTTGDRVMSKPIEPPSHQRFPGSFESSVGHSSLDVYDDIARDNPLYHNVTPHADGLYHCPWENKPEGNCQHRPEKLKTNY